MDAYEQKAIDDALVGLDGTPDKGRLGANAILAVSLASARLAAERKRIPLHEHLANLSETKKTKLPVPFCNVINGGKHAGTSLAIQEFIIIPIKAKTFYEAVRWISEIYHALKKDIKERFGKEATNVGDEGGFAPPLTKTEEALFLLEEAIKNAGYGRKIKIAIDAAASEFYKQGKYYIDEKELYANELHDFYAQLIDSYPIISIEDPFHQDDFPAFSELTKAFGSKIQVVADDLTVTNPERVVKAVDEKTANCLLLKVNQIGTLTEAFRAANIARTGKWNIMVSHRSGETEDTFIADLAVGLGCGQIKAGAPARGERTAKYNRLLRIEDAAPNLKLAKL